MGLANSIIFSKEDEKSRGQSTTAVCMKYVIAVFLHGLTHAKPVDMITTADGTSEGKVTT